MEHAPQSTPGNRSIIGLSNVGRGATRTFPARRTPDASAATDAAVCVVDDDDWVCDSLTVLLETYGFLVRACTKGTEFLDDPRRCATKCLVIDQHMPGLDGLGVIAALHRQGIFPPAILITGRLDATISARADALGVLAVLEKPFPVMRLVELVRRAVGSPR